MSRIYNINRPPKLQKTSDCIACKKAPGQPKYGLLVCSDCDERVFSGPYGHDGSDEPISAISMRCDTTGTEYKTLTVWYRFDENDTLISCEKIQEKSILSCPLLTLQGIQPITQEFLDSVTKNIKMWLTFS